MNLELYLMRISLTTLISQKDINPFVIIRQIRIIRISPAEARLAASLLPLQLSAQQQVYQGAHVADADFTVLVNVGGDEVNP